MEKLWFQLIFSLLGLMFLFVNTILFISNKAIRPLVSKTFLFYLASLCIVEIFCNIIGVLYPNNNLFLSHFFFIFQFVFLSVLYYQLFKSKIIKKGIVLIFILQTTILSYTYFTGYADFWNFNNYEIVSCSIALILYAILFIFSNIEKEHLYFHFSIGLILYLISSISIFTSGNLELVLCENPYIDIWIFNTLFYIIFQYMTFKEYKNFVAMSKKREK